MGGEGGRMGVAVGRERRGGTQARARNSRTSFPLFSSLHNTPSSPSLLRSCFSPPRPRLPNHLHPLPRAAPLAPPAPAVRTPPSRLLPRLLRAHRARGFHRAACRPACQPPLLPQRHRLGTARGPRLLLLAPSPTQRMHPAARSRKAAARGGLPLVACHRAMRMLPTRT